MIKCGGAPAYRGSCGGGWYGGSGYPTPAYAGPSYSPPVYVPPVYVPVVRTAPVWYGASYGRWFGGHPSFGVFGRYGRAVWYYGVHHGGRRH